MKKIFLMVALNLVSMHSVAMLRRVTFKVTPLTSSALATQTRHLLPGQESNPLWIKANQEVENFRAQFRCPILTAAQINELEQKITANSLNQLSALSLQQPNKFQKQKQLIIEQEVVRLLKKHSIDPSSIKIMFISSKAAKKIKDLQVGLMAVGGDIFIILDSVFQYDLKCIKALIEHEIGHLLFHDLHYCQFFENMQNKPKILCHYHKCLMEERADIHSGIQSKKNFEMLKVLRQDQLSYDTELKSIKVLLRMAQIAPKLIVQFEKLDISKNGSCEVIKAIASQECKAGKISPTVLQEIIKLCDQSTCMDDLASFYYKKNKKHKK